MNKNGLIHKYFDKAEQLTLANKNYQNVVHVLIVWLLENDQVQNDQTTHIIFGKTAQNTKAKIITRKHITLAGVEEATYLIDTFSSLKYTIVKKDGAQVKPGETIIEITGSIQEMLAYERVMLNILQRLSGIATETNTLIASLPKKNPPFIAATRKTVWGLLDKKAVTLGGGLTHRLHLADGILVKDNHLMLLSAVNTLQKIEQQTKKTLIEIEVEDEKSLLELVDSFSKSETNNTLAILLDNFTPDVAKKILDKNNFPETIIFEASGGITSNNIQTWAHTGVDIISLGSLTHSSKAADISLELV